MEDRGRRGGGEGAAIIQYPLGAGGSLTRVLEVRGDGTPVVLVHGAGARADRWRSSLAVLAARGLHGIAIDLPGHGFAAKGPGPEYSVAGFAAAVGRALDELEIDRAVLIGTSLGAHVAGRLALDRDGLAERLVLVGPSGVLPLGQVRRDSIAASLRDRSLAGIRQKLARVVADERGVDEDWVQEEYRINNSPGADESFERLASYVESRIDADAIADELRSWPSACPLLVVWGENDVSVPIGSAEEVEEACGRGEVAYVPDAGHLPYAENTGAFWEIVSPFVEATPATAGDGAA